MSAGIETRHARACRSSSGGRCNCTPSYRAAVWSPQERRLHRHASTSRAEVESWRRDAVIALRRGRTIGVVGGTLRTVAEEFLKDARAGIVVTRSGDPYKPSAIRSYESSLRLRVYPSLGDEPIKDIRRADLQELVDTLKAEGKSASTILMTIVPLKAIWRREIGRDRLRDNPTLGVALPAVRSRRERFADAVEAAALLAALSGEDRPIWATAMYAGLRRGELMALTAERIDLGEGVIRVERGWDAKEGEIETKGRNNRKVPIPSALRDELLRHLVASGRRGPDLAFGETPTVPFDIRRLTERADAAWENAGLKRITPHECRHSYASLMIAAGVNAKALCDYMGHSSIQVTYDKYGHLMPGNHGEAAGLLDAYLERRAV